MSRDDILGFLVLLAFLGLVALIGMPIAAYFDAKERPIGVITLDDGRKCELWKNNPQFRCECC
jgi:hypothetical protein